MMASLATLPNTTTSTPVGRKRSRKSATPREVPTNGLQTNTFPTDQPVLRHDPARPGPTDSAEPEEEKWAIHLLLLLKATDSARVMSDGDDNDNDSELESADSNDQSESEVEEYSRMRSSMAVDGDEEADDEEVSDVDVAARSPANIKNEAAKSESESESEDSNSMMDEEEDGDNDEDEDVDQPEEEDFSEGDEYVDPSSSTRRSRSHATRRQSSTPSPPASTPMTPHHRVTAPATASASVYPGQPEPYNSPSSFGVVPVSAIAAHSPLSSSTASAASASSKKTRKPKYSAALEARWEEKFEWLLTYKRVKGNCRVAEGNKEYPGLGKWLSNQKTLCKKGKLKAERRQKLIDVGAIADTALRSGSSSSAAARAGAMSMMTSSSPPSSPSSSASAAASPRLGMGADHPGFEGGDDDAQGPLTKRRRKGHELVVNIERIPSMSSDQEVDSAVSSPSTTPVTAGGLFSASSPFRTFQGKPILPSLSFPHPMAPGGLHPYLPPQQQPTPQQQQCAGNGSFLSFALTAMPPTVLFPSYSILGAGAATASSGPTAAPSLSLH